MATTHADLVNKLDYGSNHFKNLQMVMRHLDPTNSSSADNWEDVKQLAELTPKCICAHDIKYCFSVTHKITKEEMVLGSRCIERFFPEQKDKVKKLLSRHKTFLKNPDAKYCTHCDTRVSGRIAQDQTEQKLKPYHVKCLNKLFTKCYECGKHQGYNCECRKCLDCPRTLNDKPLWAVRCKRCWYNKKFNN